MMSYDMGFLVKTMVGCLNFYLFYSGFICYLYYLYLFKPSVVQHDFHTRRSLCRVTVTRRVPLTKKEQLIFVGVRQVRPRFIFSADRVAQSLVFCVK